MVMKKKNDWKEEMTGLPCHLNVNHVICNYHIRQFQIDRTSCKALDYYLH